MHFELQIYMEMIQDLLKAENSNLQIREDADEGVFLQQVWTFVARSVAQEAHIARRS